VVELNEQHEIVSLVEKPTSYVSDLAVIGIYYFKEVAQLKQALKEVIDLRISHSGEYQINDGIKRMMAEGKRFVTGAVTDWMDCGNKQVTVETNARMLDHLHAEGEPLIADDLVLEHSTVIGPCAIAAGVRLVNSIIGPHVSIGPNTVVENATLTNSIIQSNSFIKNCTLDQAMIGNHVIFDGSFTKVSLGDYTVLE
jgi:glucose-1-phosphate thymidylyltransferase